MAEIMKCRIFVSTLRIMAAVWSNCKILHVHMVVETIGRMSVQIRVRIIAALRI